MSSSSSNSSSYDQRLANYRSYQQEMTAISQEYSQARQANWSQEMEGMAAAWRGFQQDWQGTLEQMAGRLNMSARNLIRKLKEEDLTYQMLLDEVRKEYAVWYLINTRKSVEAIADLVGYKDTSNFSRTFRRWFGMTPKEFRKNNIQ